MMMQQQQHEEEEGPSFPTATTATATIIPWTNLPAELRNAVLQNLGERDLAEYAITSRLCRDDTAHPILPQRRTAVIRCSDRADLDLFGLGMHPLVGALLKIPTGTSSRSSSSHDSGRSSRVFQDRFTRIQLEDASRLPKINNREAKPILRSLSLPGVTHLDLSSSPSSTSMIMRSRTTATHPTGKPPHVAPSIVRLWMQVLPRLKDLDLSYNLVSTATLADIARNGQALTTLRIVGGCLASSSVTLDDFHKSSSSNNNNNNNSTQQESQMLQCLYLQNCRIATTRQEEDDVFYNDQREDVCPFSHVLDHLERMSLTGCRYYDIKKEKEIAMMQMDHTNDNNGSSSSNATMDTNYVRGIPFTQLSLVKIVRNAPNLKWFQSDLSEENVAMLREERPEVVFVR